MHITVSQYPIQNRHMLVNVKIIPYGAFQIHTDFLLIFHLFKHKQPNHAFHREIYSEYKCVRSHKTGKPIVTFNQ